MTSPEELKKRQRAANGQMKARGREIAPGITYYDTGVLILRGKRFATIKADEPDLVEHLLRAVVGWIGA